MTADAETRWMDSAWQSEGSQSCLQQTTLSAAFVSNTMQGCLTFTCPALLRTTPIHVVTTMLVRPIINITPWGQGMHYKLPTITFRKTQTTFLSEEDRTNVLNHIHKSVIWRPFVYADKCTSVAPWIKPCFIMCETVALGWMVVKMCLVFELRQAVLNWRIDKIHV